MGAIHELREEYRFYRGENPGYRWLFLLVDLASLLIKLALFGGFLFFCWYLISRNPYAEQSGLVGTKAVLATEEIVAAAAPELTDERLARLREIAGQEGPADESHATLIGSASIRTDTNSGLPEEVVTSNSGTVVVANFDVPEEPAVQVESIAIDVSNQSVADTQQADTQQVIIEQVDIAQADTGQGATESNSDPALQTGVLFTENVYIPESIENGGWVLTQNSGDHTIQLALTVNVEFLVDFAGKLPDEHTAAIYPERVNGSGNIQYSLSLGSFPSKRGAEAALAELDENLKRYGAHTRVFEEVQSNIDGFVL